MKFFLATCLIFAATLTLLNSLVPKANELPSISRRFNKYRERTELKGLRQMYYSKEMEELADKTVTECKEITEDGDYGVAFDKIEKPEDANTEDFRRLANTLFRNAFNAEISSVKNNYIHLFSPKSYLYGCAFNKQCQPMGLVVCYLNRKISNKSDLEGKFDCSQCTQTFPFCISDNMCGTSENDGVAPTSVPEDEPEESKEVIQEPAQHENVDAGSLENTKSDMESENTACGLMSFGLINIFCIIFHALNN